MHVHVISFDIPYPPNYGGIIDVYYKLKALWELGIKVHLHCFEYGRPYAVELKALCASVHYYPRMGRIASLPLALPHIISSRKSPELKTRLQEDSYPIIFEGLHTCYYLDHTEFKYRQKIVRMHNVEWQYYEELSNREENWAKRQYLLREAELLQNFERRLALASAVLTISPADTDYYSARFNNVHYIPAFHSNDQVMGKPGKGKYCLYHGKLSVAENHEAALFLINYVFKDLDIPLIIAGSEPLPDLITAINQYDHITLRYNPGEGDMLDLMRDAHIHVLPTFQTTGIKLKLLGALFSGRFCLVTPEMVRNTGLAEYCIVAQDTEEFIRLVRQLFEFPFPFAALQQREKLIQGEFSNIKNAEKIVSIIQSSI